MTITTCQNYASPLWLDIGYNNVANGGSAAGAWGIQMGIGMPPQTFSIRPSLLNFITVAPKGTCDSSVDYSCLAVVGGVYDPTVSTTEILSNETSWNSTLGNGDIYLNYVLYYDILTVGYQSNEVYGVPFATWSDPTMCE